MTEESPRPRRTATGRQLTKRVGPRVPDNVWQMADEDAAQRHLQLAPYVRQALEGYLDQPRIWMVPGVRGSSTRVISVDPELWERVGARAVQDECSQSEVVAGALAWAHEMRLREEARERQLAGVSLDEQ